MQSVGAFEAKTQLSALLERVAQGETIEITKRGVAVARLIPVPKQGTADLRQLAKEIREMRKGISSKGMSMKELINHGRKY
jgi:prevent-host-death family protein